MKRDTRTAYRARAAATERSVDAALAAVRAHQEAEREEARYLFEESRKPIPYTPEELKAARAVRTILGWYKVAKVNTKTVSVETGYSWTDRVLISKILEVRA